VLEETAPRKNCFICYLALAEYYAKSGTETFDYFAAVKNAGKAILIKPTDPGPYQIRAKLNLELEIEGHFVYFTQAIVDYLKIVELEPGNITHKNDACHSGAKAPGLLTQEMAAAVVKLCDEIISAEPNKVQNYIDRAVILAAGGSNTAAIADLDAALKLDKNSPPALLAKARVYKSLEDWRRAVFYYTKFKEQPSEHIDPDIFESRGECYLRMGKCQNARSDFEAAGKSLSGVKNIHHMAAYYWNCGKNLPKTLEYLEMLIKDGEQCEGACFRPEEYKALLTGLDETAEYKVLLGKYSAPMQTGKAISSSRNATANVSTGASPTQKMRNAALFGAIKNYDEAAILKALKDGADINAQDPDDRRGFTPLMKAAHDVSEGWEESSYKVVDLLLSKGADVNGAAPDGITALVRAACDNDLRMVKKLLENGADPNSGNYPAIICAAHYGSADMVSLLVSYKSDLNAKDGTGSTAFSASANFPEIRRILQKAGAKN